MLFVSIVINFIFFALNAIRLGFGIFQINLCLRRHLLIGSQLGTNQNE